MRSQGSSKKVEVNEMSSKWKDSLFSDDRSCVIRAGKKAVAIVKNEIKGRHGVCLWSLSRQSHSSYSVSPSLISTFHLLLKTVKSCRTLGSFLEAWQEPQCRTSQTPEPTGRTWINLCIQRTDFWTRIGIEAMVLQLLTWIYRKEFISNLIYKELRVYNEIIIMKD